MSWNMYKLRHKLRNAKIGWQSDLHGKMNLDLYTNKRMIVIALFSSLVTKLFDPM